LDLEKTNGHGKADRMAAVRAEKMRHSTKADYKRQQNLSQLSGLRQKEQSLLVMKHALPEPTPSGTWPLPEDRHPPQGRHHPQHALAMSTGNSSRSTNGYLAQPLTNESGFGYS